LCAYKKPPDCGGFLCIYFFASFSHCWLTTPQEVLQADWQEVWHSPQPPVLALWHRLRVSIVLILSMRTSPFFKITCPPIHSNRKQIILKKSITFQAFCQSNSGIGKHAGGKFGSAQENRTGWDGWFPVKI